MRRSLTFELRGVEGHVRIDYDVNDDPARWGFDRLGLDFDSQVARGFPVIEARVEYPAEGYLGYLGWIQVVAYTVIHGADRATTELVDVAPQLRAAAIPYLSFGIEPVLFDAPAFTERNVDWGALSFLAASPDLLMTPSVDPVLGFAWGYTIRGGAIDSTPLRSCDRDDWTHARRRLVEHLSEWHFGGESWEPVLFDPVGGQS